MNDFVTEEDPSVSMKCIKCQLWSEADKTVLGGEKEGADQAREEGGIRG